MLKIISPLLHCPYSTEPPLRLSPLTVLYAHRVCVLCTQGMCSMELLVNLHTKYMSEYSGTCDKGHLN